MILHTVGSEVWTWTDSNEWSCWISLLEESERFCLRYVFFSRSSVFTTSILFVLAVFFLLCEAHVDDGYLYCLLGGSEPIDVKQFLKALCSNLLYLTRSYLSVCVFMETNWLWITNQCAEILKYVCWFYWNWNLWAFNRKGYSQSKYVTLYSRHWH